MLLVCSLLSAAQRRSAVLLTQQSTEISSILSQHRALLAQQEALGETLARFHSAPQPQRPCVEPNQQLLLDSIAATQRPHERDAGFEDVLKSIDATVTPASASVSASTFISRVPQETEARTASDEQPAPADKLVSYSGWELAPSAADPLGASPSSALQARPSFDALEAVVTAVAQFSLEVLCAVSSALRFFFFGLARAAL